LRALGRDAEIAAQGQRQSASNRRSGNGRDCRLIEPPQKSHEMVKVLAHLELRFQPVAAIPRRVLEIARYVAARTEAATSAGDDHRPDLVVVTGVGQRGQRL